MRRAAFFVFLVAVVTAAALYMSSGNGGAPREQSREAAKPAETPPEVLAEAQTKKLREIGFRDLAISETEANFELTRLDGEPAALDDYSDSWVLLKFWASSCHVCLRELPLLEKFGNRLESENFRLVTVNLRDDPETIRGLKGKHELTYELLFAGSREAAGEIARTYPVRVFPASVLVAPGGRPIMYKYGFSPWPAEDFLDRFRVIFE